jgi:hypothetical protein
MILIKLPRLSSGDPNYAKLSEEERVKNKSKSDSIIPGIELFGRNVHTIFCDDVRITGMTADRIEREALSSGSLSLLSLYCLRIDTKITSYYPEIESFLNTYHVTGKLDETAISILGNPRFRPVQRMVRLVLNEDNRSELETFARDEMGERALVLIYEAAMDNDFYTDARYHESLLILQEVLKSKSLIDKHGLVK